MEMQAIKLLEKMKHGERRSSNVWMVRFPKGDNLQ